MPAVAKCLLKSNSPYSMSKPHFEPKLPKESADDYERRTWRHRCHADENGQLFVPGIALKNALAEAAEFLSERIPGKGQSTYTKHFAAGILALKNIPLPIKKDEVEGFWGFMHASGDRKSGKRVMRCYPIIHSWKGEIEFTILDSTITQEVFAKTLREAGNLIGIGRWRPRNRGMNGRFSVERIDWSELSL